MNHVAIIHTLTPATLGAGKEIQSIHLLGSEANLSFEQLPDGLHVHLPEQAVSKYSYAIRIEFASSGKQ